ncbi:MAG TPA: glycosyltransferase [Phenylobacterium sp.]
MKVALVHDYLNQYGGAERVLDELHQIWPNAPVYASIYNPARMPERYRSWDIRTSSLNRLPFANQKHQALLFMLPQAFEEFDLDEYDLVVSSSSGFAHGVLTSPSTLHVCYCHSPPRFLWDYHHYAKSEGLHGPARWIVERSLPRLRVWDRVAADRADVWISTSRLVQARIDRFYDKRSIVIPPPVDVGRFSVAPGRGDFLLMAMRLVGWKRPEIAVEACTQLGLPLVVAGDGRDLTELKRIAGPTVRFVGWADDDRLRELYRDCQAFILPSAEDFGIAPIEAMAAGKPVIAYGSGGVLDTVLPGETGLLFRSQTAESLAAVLSTFDPCDFDPVRIRRHAETFDKGIFAARLKSLVEIHLRKHRMRQELAQAPLLGPTQVANAEAQFV